MQRLALFTGMGLLTLSACANLTVHDKRVCANGPGGIGACDNIYTEDQAILTEAQWNVMRVGWLCVSPNDFGYIKEEIENACSLINCTYEQREQMKAAFKKIDQLRMK